MNYSRGIWLVALSFVLLQRACGQGFFNLDFESTTLAAGGAPSTVSASSAFPGWTVFFGTTTQSSVLYNNATLEDSSVTLLAGGNNSPMPVYDGSFSAMLFAGASGDPSLTQTGLVPSDAESLRFYIYFGGATSFSVSLNGQAIRITALQPLALNSYNLLGGDISQFAGQVATLQITSVFPTTPHLIVGGGGGGGGGVYPIGIDDIQFSSSPVPEPGVLSLLGISLIILFPRIRRHNF